MRSLKLPENFRFERNALKDIKRCFIFANGPTLQKIRLDQFENEVVIGVNCLLYSGFTPTFLCVSGHQTFVEHHNPGYLELASQADTKFVLASRVLNYINNFNIMPKDKIIKVFNLITRLNFDLTKLYEGDLDATYVTESVVSDIAIPLAAYLGIKEIYILGLDGYHEPLRSNALHFYSGTRDFDHRNYVQRTQPIAKVWFGKIDVGARLQGITIKNLTPGTSIWGFERDDIHKIFPDYINNKILNIKNKYFEFQNNLIHISSANNGKSGACSLLDIKSGLFVRHFKGEIILSDNNLNPGKFEEDSSFFPEASFVDINKVSFRSCNYPDHYITREEYVDKYMIKSFTQEFNPEHSSFKLFPS